MNAVDTAANSLTLLKSDKVLMIALPLAVGAGGSARIRWEGPYWNTLKQS